MAMNLPTGSLASSSNAASWKRIIEQTDAQNFKKGQDVIVSPGRLILTDTNGGTWQVTVSTSGTLTATAVTLPVRGTSD